MCGGGEGLNEGERGAGNGIRKGKLKRTENWGGGLGEGERGGDILVYSYRIDVIDVPDFEEMMELNRTLLL